MNFSALDWKSSDFYTVETSNGEQYALRISHRCWTLPNILIIVNVLLLQGGRQGRLKVLYRSELLLWLVESGDAQGYREEAAWQRKEGNVESSVAFRVLKTSHLHTLILWKTFLKFQGVQRQQKLKIVIHYRIEINLTKQLYYDILILKILNCLPGCRPTQNMLNRSERQVDGLDLCSILHPIIWKKFFFCDLEKNDQRINHSYNDFILTHICNINFTLCVRGFLFNQCFLLDFFFC